MRWLPLGLLLGACAAPAPQWEKPGASRAALDEALQQCRVRASLSPQPHVSGPIARSSSSPGLDRIDERQARETQQFEKCMADLGFTLTR